MAYEEKLDGSTDKIYKLGAPGEPKSVEGYYLGSKIIPSTKKGFKDSILHIFRTEEEGSVGLWGTTRLNRLLTSDIRGMMCLVEFTGMIEPSQKGMRPAYGFKVLFDKERTIPVDHIQLGMNDEEVSGDYNEERDGDESFEPTSFVSHPPKKVVHR